LPARNIDDAAIVADGIDHTTVHQGHSVSSGRNNERRTPGGERERTVVARPCGGPIRRSHQPMSPATARAGSQLARPNSAQSKNTKRSARQGARCGG